jgi:hypothetical protein
MEYELTGTLSPETETIFQEALTEADSATLAITYKVAN